MMYELRHYCLCAVVCGPNAAFWGATGSAILVIDEATTWLHRILLDHEIPSFHGLPFWTDLVPCSRQKKGKVDAWHHADGNTDKMSLLCDKYFFPTSFACSS